MQNLQILLNECPYFTLFLLAAIEIVMNKDPLKVKTSKLSDFEVWMEKKVEISLEIRQVFLEVLFFYQVHALLENIR